MDGYQDFDEAQGSADDEQPLFEQDGPGLFDVPEPAPAAAAPKSPKRRPSASHASVAPADEPGLLDETPPQAGAPASAEPIVEADAFEISDDVPGGDSGPEIPDDEVDPDSDDDPDVERQVAEVDDDPIDLADLDEADLDEPDVPVVQQPEVPAPAASSERAEAPLALYRRYRPDTFADVIGQEHVTEPLKRALENNRVNHAYLFSGPRGCGKTTSARILARALNCEQGPTPEPCGVCQSCRDLARGGSGSIDVIEIDAASHGGVDDARDLRERAFFAPVNSRYKIYIVDEAHMVTTAGFNAMLKLVEEPPPHVKFIFATTEPEKVIGTIRSRTHHYPFRLVPPRVLTSYLGELCDREGVQVEPTVLPLVVRAGAGSVRDSLSVLDQLLGGAGPDGVSYSQASALLGYTPDALLDDILDAFAAGDAASVFATIDRVIEVGQDPRRFAEDLLRRLRDLVIVAAVPTAISSGLIEVSGDQAERLRTQAAGMGAAELTRAAQVMAAGLTEMRGTTAPRLHLELMCARVLLPGADVDERGIHARLDRLERRLGATGAPAVSEAPSHEWSDAPTQRTAEVTDSGESRSSRSAHVTDGSAVTSRSEADPVAQRPAGQRPGQRPAGRQPAVPAPGTDRAPTTTSTHGDSAEPSPQVVRSGAQMTAADLRRVWPTVLEAVRGRRRFAWILLSQNAQVIDLADGVLTIGFANQGARDSFMSGGSSDVLRDCLIESLMLDVRIAPIVAGGSGNQRASAATAPQPGRGQRPAANLRPGAGHGGSAADPGSAGGRGQHPSDRRPGGPGSGEPRTSGRQADPPSFVPPPDEPPSYDDEPPPPEDEPTLDQSAPRGVAPGPSAAAPVESLRERASRRAASASEPDPSSAPSADSYEVSQDDMTLDDSGVTASDLIKEQLGGEVIHEE